MRSTVRSFHPLLLLTVLLCASCSCCQQTKKVEPPPEPLTMSEVVEKINRNNTGVQSIWAKLYYEAEIHDKKAGKDHFVNGNGTLMYKRSSDFRLIANKELTKKGKIFEVGSTSKYYWFMLFVDPETMWFGEHKNIGKPCVQSIPIQPNLVMEVLGVGLFDTNFMANPAPVMRYNPDSRCYMFVWVTPSSPGDGPQRVIAQREIWYDDVTFLPRQVILFDTNGKVVLRALLSKHKPVGEGGGLLATSYSLFFPDSRSKMSFDINDLRTDNGKGIPTERGIAFPGSTPQEADVEKVIKLDKDCKD